MWMILSALCMGPEAVHVGQQSSFLGFRDICTYGAGPLQPTALQCLGLRLDLGLERIEAAPKGRPEDSSIYIY